jgi:glycosyltransferase involved in cell wall biosynthesis
LEAACEGKDGRWVGHALRSAVGQTHQPHEITVIDDRSTCSSVQIALDSSVALKLVRTERANGAGTRNAGIQIATEAR